MALNQEGLQGTRMFVCSQHPAVDVMIAQVLYISSNAHPQTHLLMKTAPSIYYVSPLEGTFIHVSYSLFNQSRVSNGSSFFLPLPGIENPRKPQKIRLSRGISLEQLVRPRDTVTTAASLPEASLANPDYFVI